MNNNYSVWYYDQDEELKEAPIEKGRTVESVAQEYANYYGCVEICDEEGNIIHSILPN